MRLHQTPAFGPFVGEPILSTHITCWACNHKIFRVIASATRDGNNVVYVPILSVFAKSAHAPIAFAFLSFELTLYVKTSKLTCSRFFARPSIVSTCCCDQFPLFCFCILSLQGIDVYFVLLLVSPPGCSGAARMRHMIEGTFYLCSLISFLSSLNDSFWIFPFKLFTLLISTLFADTLQTMFKSRVSKEKLFCSRLRYIALLAHQLIGTALSLLFSHLISLLGLYLYTLLAVRMQSVCLATTLVEELCCRSEYAFTFRALLTPIRNLNARFSTIFTAAKKSIITLFVGKKVLTRCRVGIATNRTLFERGVFWYSIVHDKACSLSSRHRVLAHRDGNNILLHLFYHKTAL